MMRGDEDLCVTFAKVVYVSVYIHDLLVLDANICILITSTCLCIYETSMHSSSV